jgi:hypothetical protein
MYLTQLGIISKGRESEDGTETNYGLSDRSVGVRAPVR